MRRGQRPQILLSGPDAKCHMPQKHGKGKQQVALCFPCSLIFVSTQSTACFSKRGRIKEMWPPENSREWYRWSGLPTGGIERMAASASGSCTAAVAALRRL